MDAIYCLLMAIYMMLTASSDKTGKVASKFLYGLSFIMACFAVLHIVWRG